VPLFMFSNWKDNLKKDFIQGFFKLSFQLESIK